jgi:hypothetical protein
VGSTERAGHEEAPGEDRGFVAEEESQDRRASDALLERCDAGSSRFVTRVTKSVDLPLLAGQ